MTTDVLTRTSRGLVGAYPALGYPAYRLLWGGTVVSLTGFWMQALAQGWLVYSLTNSPLMLGLVGAFQAVPNIALTLVGGVAADRFDRRRLLILTRSVSLTLSLSTAALVATGLIQVWHVFAFSAILGVVWAFDMPANQALVPSLVQPRHLTSAVALISAAFNGTRIVGPSIAGVIVARFGVAGCYLAAGLATATMVAALLALRAPPSPVGKRGALWTHVRDGLAYVRRDELRVALLGLMLVNSLFGMAYPTLMPVFARDVLGSGEIGYGLIMAASGVGSLAGTLLVAGFGHLPRMGRVTIGASVAFGVMLIAFATSTSFALSLALMVLVGLANATYGTLVTTLVQARLDEEYRGRAMSVFALTMSMMPLAGLQAGALASVSTPALALQANGVVVVAASLAAAAFVPRLRRA